jgi:ERCC4-type nuclease
MIDYTNLKIVIDTREQQPWEFSRCVTASKKLDTGDYSLEGYEHLLCIERKKSVGEIANNIVEKRFKDVIDRMTNYKYAFFIMEFNMQDILSYPIGSNVPKKMWDKLRVSSGFILKVLLEIQLKYNIKILFCGDASNASKVAQSLMTKVYELEQQ